MELKEIHLNPPAGFYRDYINQRTELTELFDYTYESADWLKRRANELSEREFDEESREKLIAHLLQTHEELDRSEATKANIRKLSHKDALAIVGGQQAGLLTGPLFTIYKALTILLTAKQQESELSVPVVPIFWVAGEDHDFEEIRYVYRAKEGKWRKHPIQDEDTQCSASLKQLPEEELFQWLDGVFEELPETDFTCDLITRIRNKASSCKTYTDFFIHLMNEFFVEEGLVFVDANHPDLRRLEVNYFKQLINHMEELQGAQQEGLSKLTDIGYDAPIITEEENAHLFLNVDNKRVRLDYEEGTFSSKNEEVSFSKGELIKLVESHPERFSNNVVTRPLMQEWLLPVLAFIPGPGELAYWATLKPAFNQFGWCMPPLIPRLQVTIVPRSVKKWVEQEELSFRSFLEGEGEQLKQHWLQKQHQYPIEEVTTQVKDHVHQIHQPLRELAETMDPTLQAMSEKNIALIMNQIQFLENKMHRHIYETHKTAIDHFDEVLYWLKPLGSPQERILHPIILINIVGQSGLKQILQQPMAINGVHKLIYL
ncbi:bacillithiol biosynthesis cysteine-adding enzyme BshC [Alkalicoccobacillus murimartini]|uniref:Putative cysteine ligase BshC n=1 Tax=Alkalicoccobacillus murimartini TaxID=171685 RepID=A0ABT9YFG7_9BACI|nr:bacillithiol biosynthesis cysteine-adding enzyme BshC [Alkalicoccobacillus murimartini]MDQ0206454.1 bacillithiol biosynthesis cysteine-adding enzyme BshC [Alkalicoccobacillus murimartini]